MRKMKKYREDQRVEVCILTLNQMLKPHKLIQGLLVDIVDIKAKEFRKDNKSNNL